MIHTMANPINCITTYGQKVPHVFHKWRHYILCMTISRANKLHWAPIRRTKDTSPSPYTSVCVAFVAMFGKRVCTRAIWWLFMVANHEMNERCGKIIYTKKTSFCFQFCWTFWIGYACALLPVSFLMEKAWPPSNFILVRNTPTNNNKNIIRNESFAIVRQSPFEQFNYLFVDGALPLSHTLQ